MGIQKGLCMRDPEKSIRVVIPRFTRQAESGVAVFMLHAVSRGVDLVDSAPQEAHYTVLHGEPKMVRVHEVSAVPHTAECGRVVTLWRGDFEKTLADLARCGIIVPVCENM
ncbi:TPA: hypothetical protein DCS34_02305 [Candidatus Peribacteria bacterium]|nr:hypothetical protein [Candidatus Peribacteria bacterium]